jgi:hypothetical protein
MKTIENLRENAAELSVQFRSPIAVGSASLDPIP